jgi:hypothetical protein
MKLTFNKPAFFQYKSGGWPYFGLYGLREAKFLDANFGVDKKGKN